jgi:hypothetical protein
MIPKDCLCRLKNKPLLARYFATVATAAEADAAQAKAAVDEELKALVPTDKVKLIEKTNDVNTS